VEPTSTLTLDLLAQAEVLDQRLLALLVPLVPPAALVDPLADPKPVALVDLVDLLAELEPLDLLDPLDPLVKLDQRS